MKRFDEQEIKAVTDVIKSGKLSQFFCDFNGGEQIQAFEKEFAQYVGAKHAISVANGTVAIEIALKALGIGRGDQVITTPLSFAATSTAILAVGAEPVFVDIDPETLTLDYYAAKKAINKKTKAVIPVSLLGYPADVDYDLPVIEDSAQALGSRSVKGTGSPVFQNVGSRATLSTFSLQETKNITSLGEGGMITTNNISLAKICAHIRNHGNVYGNMAYVAKFGHYGVDHVVCTNARMTEAQAAFGRVQLRKLPHILKTIYENQMYFMDNVLVKVKYMEYLSKFYHRDNPYLLVPFKLNEYTNRDNLLGYLKAKGISKGIPGHNVGYYKQLIYDLPIFEPYRPRWRRPKCPNAEAVIKRIILFDIHRWQSTALINKCLKVLEEYKP